MACWAGAAQLGLVLATMLLAGCAKPLNYVHPNADLSYVRAVAIVPFKNLTQEKCAEEKVMHVVATEMLRRGVDVVEFGEVAKVLRGEGYGKDDGSLSRKVAESAARRLGVQAFLVGAVQEYGQASKGGDDAPEVCVSLRLIDANTCTILWEADHSLKGTTVLDRLFGIGKKSRTDLCRDVVTEMFASLFNARRELPEVLAKQRTNELRHGLAGM
jgi:TolB-like protein